jgi:predicted RNase H-like HicB family nuclease
MKYAVVIERGSNSFGAHVPDLPGCVAVGKSKEEVLRLIREAIDIHVQSLREHGEKVPSPSSSVEVLGGEHEKVGFDQGPVGI